MFNQEKPKLDEVAADELRWRASGYSNGAGGMCVQVAQVKSGPGAGGVIVRDSKDPDGAMLSFSEEEWLNFLDDADAFRFEKVI